VLDMAMMEGIGRKWCRCKREQASRMSCCEEGMFQGANFVSSE
jgi:hypothetical protein